MHVRITSIVRPCAYRERNGPNRPCQLSTRFGLATRPPQASNIGHSVATRSGCKTREPGYRGSLEVHRCTPSVLCFCSTNLTFPGDYLPGLSCRPDNKLWSKHHVVVSKPRSSGGRAGTTVIVAIAAPSLQFRTVATSELPVFWIFVHRYKKGSCSRA